MEIRLEQGQQRVDYLTIDVVEDPNAQQQNDNSPTIGKDDAESNTSVEKSQTMLLIRQRAVPLFRVFKTIEILLPADEYASCGERR